MGGDKVHAAHTVCCCITGSNDAGLLGHHLADACGAQGQRLGEVSEVVQKVVDG
jgi:hypothetical protein